MTPDEPKKDVSRLVINGKIYLLEMEDTAGCERLVINGKVYYRSIAEEKRIKAEELALLRSKHKANVKVMIYSVHNIP